MTISFRTRVYDQPTVFNVFVGNSSLSGDLQGAVPAWYGADRVHVPEIPLGRSVLRNLTCTQIFTPNHDHVNDECRLRFTVVKADRLPRVRVFRLDGAPNRTPDLRVCLPVITVGRTLLSL